MDIRFILLFVAIFVLFISMGKNPFEAPEGYVPPDEFKDGIRAKIEGNSTFGNAGSVSPFGGAGSQSQYYQNNTGGMGGMVASPSGPINPAQPALQPYSSPNTYTNMQQQQGIGTMPQPQNNALGIAPPTPPQGNNPYTGQQSYTPNNVAPAYQQPSYQPTNPAPFQGLPSPGSYLNLPNYVPRFADRQGRLLAFSGPEVYTTNSEGRAMLVQDGTYTLNDGRTIIVKGGKRWWPVDANKM